MQSLRVFWIEFTIPEICTLIFTWNNELQLTHKDCTEYNSRKLRKIIAIHLIFIAHFIDIFFRCFYLTKMFQKRAWVKSTLTSSIHSVYIKMTKPLWKNLDCILFVVYSHILINNHKAAVKQIISFVVEIDCYYLHIIHFVQKHNWTLDYVSWFHKIVIW